MSILLGFYSKKYSHRMVKEQLAMDSACFGTTTMLAVFTEHSTICI